MVREDTDQLDLDLHRRLRSGDHGAFEDLYRRYAAGAYGLALRVTGQEMLAQEVIHDAFLALWRAREALQALPEDQRTVLEMAYFGGSTQAQIAEELGIPLGTVKTRTLAAMRKLRKALQEDEEEESCPRCRATLQGFLRVEGDLAFAAPAAPPPDLLLARLRTDAAPARPDVPAR